jgi:hypothetical protein
MTTYSGDVTLLESLASITSFRPEDDDDSDKPPLNSRRSSPTRRITQPQIPTSDCLRYDWEHRPNSVSQAIP